MDIAKVMEAIKEDWKTLGLTLNHRERTLRPITSVYREINDHVVETHIQQVLLVLSMFNKTTQDQLICEIDLRRILHEYLCNATDFHVSSIIEQIKEFHYPEDHYISRKFYIPDVVKVLNELKAARTSDKLSHFKESNLKIPKG